MVAISPIVAEASRAAINGAMTLREPATAAATSPNASPVNEVFLVRLKSLDFCCAAVPGLDLRRGDFAKQRVVLVRHRVNVYADHRHVALFDGVLAVFDRLLEYFAKEPGC